MALRYLLSRKSHGAVNIISAISVAAVAVAAAAMIIVLSVFNGFSSLAEKKLSKIDPDFMLTPLKGKSIAGVDSLCVLLRDMPGVETAEPQITEQAFAVAADRQMGVTLMGMTPRGVEASGIGGAIIDGSATLGVSADSDTTDNIRNGALLSVGAAMGLNLRPTIGLENFTIYEPRREGRINPANPAGAFRSRPMQAKGVYQIEQEEYDRNVIIVPYELAATLLNYTDRATSIAVTAQKATSMRELTSRLTGFASINSLEVKDRYRQQEQAFRMIAIEKWITFCMLGFILVIASFNIVSTLSMMMLEKEGNMNILRAMGATRSAIDRIFVSQGWLIVIAGGIAGLCLGTALVLGQQHFGWIKLSAPDPSLMTVDSYPVMLLPADMAVTLVAVTGVALVITPAILLLRRSR